MQTSIRGNEDIQHMDVEASPNDIFSDNVCRGPSPPDRFGMSRCILHVSVGKAEEMRPERKFCLLKVKAMRACLEKVVPCLSIASLTRSVLSSFF